MMAWRLHKKKKNTILVSKDLFQSSIDVIKTYTEHIGIKVVIGDIDIPLIDSHKNDLIGIVIQTPDAEGFVHDYQKIIYQCK